MGKWLSKDHNHSQANGVTGLSSDLGQNTSHAKNKIKLLQDAEAEPRDEHENQNMLNKICQEEATFAVNDGILEAAKDFKDTDMEKRKGKYNPKGPAAKTRKATIRLYCAEKTDVTDYVIRELETKLTSQVPDGMNFTIVTCREHQRIQSSELLIVICLISSRLKADFDNAVSGVQTGSQTAVLIFHHMKEHALPTEPSYKQLTEAESKDVGIIIDVAFFEDMGMYDCAMNTKAFKKLIKFIDNHCKT